MAISVGSLAFETEKLRLFDKGPSFNGHRKGGLPFLTCGTAGNRSSGEPETGARRKPEFVLKGKPERIAISVDPLVMDGIAVNPRDFPRYVLSDKAQKSRLEKDSSAPGLDNSSDLSNDLSVGPNHKSGYVALVGRPNVGKSTLMNQLIGQKLSIVTSKPQTTRHRILGICSEVDYQMILFDTPGVIPKKMHKLDDMMMQNVKSATINADCVLVIVDATENPEKALSILEDGASEAIKKRPTLLVLNKKDLIKPGEIAKKKQLYEEFNDLDEVIVVSAKYGHGVDELKKWLVSKLPLGPAYYPKDYVSEHPEKFFVSEIVREKIFMQYVKEIPYCCQVNVSNYVEREPPAKDFVGIEIIVEKETQKAILLGKNGQALKTLATAARLDIEDFVGRQVYIETRVKVKEHWRKDEDLLREYGYSGKF